MSSSNKVATRYGIGEWYGKSFSSLSVQAIKELAEIQQLPKTKRPKMECPFQSCADRTVFCTKDGGVCSLRLYQNSKVEKKVSPVSDDLCTTCPKRFHEKNLIFGWVGQVVLKCERPLAVGEVGFLENVSKSKSAASKDDVGRIDNVLVYPNRDPMYWCALEIQAVYFSGSSMSREFAVLTGLDTLGIPFPVGHRRPDYRSSGPKRLMPQLQIKVPTLRRWGKKNGRRRGSKFLQRNGQDGRSWRHFKRRYSLVHRQLSGGRKPFRYVCGCRSFHYFGESRRGTYGGAACYTGSF